MAGAFSFFSAVHVSFGPFLEGTSTLTHVLSTFDTITRRHKKCSRYFRFVIIARFARKVITKMIYGSKL